jgi:hypothetical protein
MAARWLTFTDPDHLSAAAGAAPVLGLDHALDTRQIGRQRPMWLRPLGGVRLRGLVGGLRRGAVLVTSLRLGDRGLDVLKSEGELIGVQLLGARAEPGAAHLS